MIRLLACSLVALTLAPPAVAAPAPAAEPPIPPRACTPYWMLVDEPPVAPRAKLCDPTHEKLTLAALRRAKVQPKSATLDYAAIAEVLAGVQWNDDPEGLLAGRGAAWATAFREAQQATLAGATFGPADPLVARSHFGDLQFLHAMASRPDEDPRETYRAIERWAEFTFKVATGAIAGTTKLDDVPIAGLAALFPKHGQRTVAELFGVAKGGDVKQRALGSLLHVVEDAFATGHARRLDREGLLGGVQRFASYAKAKHGRRADDKGWREAWRERATPSVVQGGDDAIQRASEIVRLTRHAPTWPAMKQFLDTQVVSLAPAPQD